MGIFSKLIEKLGKKDDFEVKEKNMATKLFCARLILKESENYDY